MLTKTERTKLWKALDARNSATIEALLPKLDRETVQELLRRAVWHGDLASVQLALRAGGNPNQTAGFGTLLMLAAAKGDLPKVKCLIEAGADLNREYKRETALSSALSQNRQEVIKYLEKSGATSPPAATLLYACTHGDVTRAKQAIAAGAGLEKTGGVLCETPLMAAARTGQLATVKLLLAAGANPNTRIKGTTALFDAVEHGKNLEVLNALTQGGASIQEKHDGETVLMAAARGGSVPIVKRLVELGADVQARDKNLGLRALDLAKQNKCKDVVAFLSSVGAKSDRDGARAMMRALAKDFGGKIVEYSHGLSLNAKLAGNKCRFNTYTEECSVVVFKLKFLSEAFRKVGFPTIMVAAGKPHDPYDEFYKSPAATKAMGLQVYSNVKANAVTEQKALVSFCTQLQRPVQALGLTAKECITITDDTLHYEWHGTDVTSVRSRISKLASFIRSVTRPPQAERYLFNREWLLKPVATVGPKPQSHVHALGGAHARPVACPQCGQLTNRMAQIDLADASLPATPLGRKPLPIFWCLACGEWDAVFYDISGPDPKPLLPGGKIAKPGKLEAGEADLPECPAMLVPVPAGKKAGRKSKVGGAPTWIQSEQSPDCPSCKQPMAFILQLASDARISYGDMGLLYAFACPDCKTAASLVQSH